MLVAESAVMVPGFPGPKSTVVTPRRPVPVTVTVVPPAAGPLAGVTPVTVGTASMSGPAAPQAAWPMSMVDPSRPPSRVICIAVVLMPVVAGWFGFGGVWTLRVIVATGLRMACSVDERRPSRGVLGGMVVGRVTVVPSIDRPVMVMAAVEPRLVDVQ